MSRTDAHTGTEAGRSAGEMRARTTVATADRAAGTPDRAPDREHPHPWFERPVTEQERERIAGAAGELSRSFLGLDQRYDTVAAARRHVLRFLDWLQTFHGDSYQQLWVASGADQGGPDWAPGLSNPRQRPGIRVAASALILLRVIRPSDEWLLTAHLTKLWWDWTDYHDRHVWERFFAAGAATNASKKLLRSSATVLVRICIRHGIGVEQIRAEHMLQHRDFLAATGRSTSRSRVAMAWHHARAAGLLAGEPDTIEVLLRSRKQSATELVDRYQIASAPVRALLIDYLTELEPTHDYASREGIAQKLASVFWKDLENHHPGIDTIALSTDQAAGWKQRVKTRSGGRVRRDHFSVLGVVRTFYLDIAAWAHEQPRWAPWAVPCPISSRDLHGIMPARRATTARMQARTRTLAPHMPRLVEHARRRRDQAERLLAQAQAADPCEEFDLDNTRYRRLRLTKQAEPGTIRVCVVGQDKRFDPILHEERAFWTWASVETLRHSGMRLEELKELTHLSIRQFTKPDGETVPLLQIAPSKTDRERIIPCSPQLTAVLAQIVTRLLGADGAIPVSVRYDHYEREHSAPMPFLFQIRRGPRPRAMSGATIQNYIADLATDAGLLDTDGSPLRLTPHDFRRLFITDLVTEGFPIHLAAQLVGHQHIDTTRGYTAVYEHEVFAAYDRFITARRELRPAAEYREPTQQEWHEFHEHFSRRRIALGSCRRPYGSDCAHEHACLRCNFLQVDPGEITQLDAIEDNLHARIAEAESNSWLGDVEQLHLTVRHLRDKRDQVQQLLDSLPGPLLTAAPDR
ncbi:tyrosine-type recombinase/integrase [Pseudonocardia kongjuensis]|uniref:Tyrosine-type recombinase/integrase n=1 Tax=Pseudonocardia kongjuensis TaxID=102227 RepID=A0ABP4I505_9PSEU